MDLATHPLDEDIRCPSSRMTDLVVHVVAWYATVKGSFADAETLYNGILHTIEGFIATPRVPVRAHAPHRWTYAVILNCQQTLAAYQRRWQLNPADTESWDAMGTEISFKSAFLKGRISSSSVIILYITTSKKAFSTLKEEDPNCAQYFHHQQHLLTQVWEASVIEEGLVLRETFIWQHQDRAEGKNIESHESSIKAEDQPERKDEEAEGEEKGGRRVQRSQSLSAVTSATTHS
ncbi:hypothetical protein E2C01_024992 [Portunus trituberculatus]|uniref:Uncharacterized protein n=1 Tax=Portunus trituberculatus TaxID=210409 RepID=A0A5B7EES8_PORTR|nr:hypothetical protein [Portunus trituberculatus]